jgi:hypothetical protein
VFAFDGAVVEAFNGAEVFLNIHSGKLRKFKV